MKKQYFMIAAAATLFAACAETDVINDIIEESAPQAIGFETFADKITRQVSNATDLNSYHGAFGVWAYKSTNSREAVMPNYQVRYKVDGDNLTWEYAGVNDQTIKYWDKNADYEFYAYAPYNATNVNSSINARTITIKEGEYAANENLQSKIVDAMETGLSTTLNSKKFSGVGDNSSTASTDWMIANVVSKPIESNDTKTYGTVEEVFTHTMSKLVVKLKSTVANTVINSVSVNDVHGTGSYDGREWSTGENQAKSILGATGTIINAGTHYYTMEYLLIPSNTPPTFSVNYTISGDTYNVEEVAITNITSFKANTKYELTVTIDLNAIQFNATASDFSTPGGDGGSVSIQ